MALLGRCSGPGLVFSRAKKFGFMMAQTNPRAWKGSWSIGPRQGVVGSPTTFNPRASPYFGAAGDLAIITITGNSSLHSSSLANWTRVPLPNRYISSTSSAATELWWRRLDGTNNDNVIAYNGSESFDVVILTLYTGYIIGNITTKFIDTTASRTTDTRVIPGYTPSVNGRGALVWINSGRSHTSSGYSPMVANTALRIRAPMNTLANNSTVSNQSIWDDLAYSGGDFNVSGLVTGATMGTSSNMITVVELS